MKISFKNVVKILTVSLVGFIVIVSLLLAFASFETDYRKAPNATIKVNLASLRVHAEKYKVNNGSYEGFCESEEVLSVSEIIFDIQSEEKFLPVDRDTSYSCNADANSFKVSASLTTSGEYFCADSTGFSGLCSPSASTEK